MAISGLSVLNACRVPPTPWDNFQCLMVSYDPEFEVLTYQLRSTPRPCFTLEVLKEIRNLQMLVKSVIDRDLRRLGKPSIRYVVAESGARDGTNFGGDLDFFLTVIRAGDRSLLTHYANLAIEVLYRNYMNFEVGVSTIAVIKGATLGAGFEAALSCDVVIADRSARIGFPEVLFNMFPGMGAYSFLARRISPAQAERMILSGKLHSAEELYEMSIVDVLADEGETDKTLRRFFQTAYKKTNTRSALLQIRNIVNRISFEELEDIATLWVDTAFRLSESNLEMMERLVTLQNRRARNLASNAQFSA